MPNPYNFIRLEGTPYRRKTYGHEKFQGHSGIIYCRLETMTPLFTAGNQAGNDEQLAFPTNGQGTPVIPGSSLKGMLRSIAEAVSNSCLCLSSELFYRGRLDIQNKYIGKLDRAFSPCKYIDKLCPACRIFGMIGSKGQLHQGKVSIGEAPAEKFEWAMPILITLMNPRPTHVSFYLPQNHVAGRKAYYHRPQGCISDTSASNYNKQVKPIAPHATFLFEVYYHNLLEEEQNLLFYSLFLEKQLYHKLGMGKPLGLGSCKITPLKVERIDYSQRYRQMGKGKSSLEGDELKNFIDTATQNYTQSSGDNLQDLREILHFDPTTPKDYQYPDRDWFKRNSTKPLSEVP